VVGALFYGSLLGCFVIAFALKKVRPVPLGDVNGDGLPLELGDRGLPDSKRAVERPESIEKKEI
jgi:hypothetical protein